MKKQETLKEAAEKYANESFIPMRNSQGEPLRIPVGQSVPCGFTKHKKIANKHFTAGYKLAQERSYSEEEVNNIFYAICKHSFFEDNVETVYLQDVKDEFEQFKKK